MSAENQLVAQSVGAFKISVDRTAKVWSSLIGEQLYQEIAPGKNRVIYILGHLTATSDVVSELLGFGPRLHPELDAIFRSVPDKAVATLPGSAELKGFWDEIHAPLLEKIAKLTPAEWLERHTAVSEEDFAKEPHRNRFSILLSRTGHIAYHLGQIIPGTK